MMPRVKRVAREDTGLLEAIWLLERRSFSDGWSYHGFYSALLNPCTRIYAALDDTDALMGYLVFTQVVDTADVEDLAVAPECRRQGVASLLLETALEGLDAQVFLEVRMSNAPAIALYQKFGFTQCGIRKDYYEKPQEDALLMVRKNPESSPEERNGSC